ncbi:MAG: cation transporter [Planctomycetes bacterium]|nr:cation transporter [Planctomycetota bacterium]
MVPPETPEPVRSGPSCHGEICPAPRQTLGAGSRRGLWAALLITTVVMVAEVAGGLVTNSLALLADAGHMLTDVAAIGLSLFAIWFATRPAPAKKSYGYLRLEILAALANGVTLFLICLLIFYEAWERLHDPPRVKSDLMLAVAVLGLAANLASAWILHRSKGHAHPDGHPHEHEGEREEIQAGDRGREENLNVRGAYLHVLGDALGSVGAIGAAVAIKVWGWELADPVASVAIGLVVLVGAVRLVFQSVDVLMEATPAHIDLDEMARSLAKIPGVRSLHDLHVWTITSGMHVLTVHVVLSPDETPSRDELLHRIVDRIRDEYQIEHATVQIEAPRAP